MIKLITQMVSGQSTVAFPPAYKSKQWKEAGRRPAFAPLSKKIVCVAKKILKENSIPRVRFTDVWNYFRTGKRKDFDRFELLNKLEILALAECIERKGVYLDRLHDYILAICEMTSWVMSAHIPEIPKYWGVNYGKDKDGIPVPDLSACMTSASLAVVLSIFNDVLHPAIKERMVYEINRQVLDPFLKHKIYWLSGINNWTAVCCTGVIISALLTVKDKRKSFKILAKALPAMDLFVRNAFSKDGTSEEGITYWNYGFSWFIFGSVFLEKWSKGRIDFFKNPKVKEIAQFPVRCEIDTNKFPVFSDCGLETKVPFWILHFLGMKLQLPSLAAMSKRYSDNVNKSILPVLVSLFALPKKNPRIGKEKVSPCNFLPDSCWMISREKQSLGKGLVLAVKGGHNDEPHNHNDVGSFNIFSDGEYMLGDAGTGVYDKNYFSRLRYENILCSSLGHPVPVVGGMLQGTGRRFCGKVISQSANRKRDELVLEMKDVYPEEARIESLTRKIALVRGQNSAYIELSDEYVFEKRAGNIQFESRIVGLLPIKLKRDRAVSGMRRNKLEIIYDVKNVSARVEKKANIRLGHEQQKKHTLYSLVLKPRIKKRCGKVSIIIRRV